MCLREKVQLITLELIMPTFSFWLPKEFQLNHIVFWIVPFSFLEKTGPSLVKLLMHTAKKQAHRIHRKVNGFRWADWCASRRSLVCCSISKIVCFLHILSHLSSSSSTMTTSTSSLSSSPRGRFRHRRIRGRRDALSSRSPRRRR